MVLAAIRAGVDLVQIREKDLATRELLELVKAAVDHARGTRTAIVVNDRLDLALGLGAAGVHVGNQSLAPEVVRSRVPHGFLLGVSCHSLAEAQAAAAAGPDYALFGPVFATLSKMRYGPPLGVERLREAAASVRIPLLALGGVTVERTKLCLEAGATGIAGISLFQTAPSIEHLVHELRSIHRLSLGRRVPYNRLQAKPADRATDQRRDEVQG